MNQVFINILYSGLNIYLLGFALNLNYRVSKAINLLYASYIPLAAYITIFLRTELSFSILLSSSFSILFVLILNFLIEQSFIIKLILRSKSSHITLIASLGFYIIITQLISIFWGDSYRSIQVSSTGNVYDIIGGKLTYSQILFFIFSIGIILTVHSLLKISSFKTKINAIAENRLLANNFGISFKVIQLFTSSLTTMICSIIGVLAALDTGFHPAMGFNMFIYAFIVIIIGGTNSYFGILLGAILLSVTQHVTAYFIDSRWIEFASYLVLLIFLFIKPLGFAGKHLKKTEI